MNAALPTSRNIDEVFFGGGITVAVFADNASRTATGGRMGSVQALGGIRRTISLSIRKASAIAESTSI